MSRLALAISNVHMLEGNPVGVDGPASVFVDIIGLPFTPLFSRGRPAHRAARLLVWHRSRCGGAISLPASRVRVALPAQFQP